MATINNITTTYSGADAKKFVRAALLSNNTIENGYITVLPNLYGDKQVMHKLSVDDVLKDASCDFDPTSTITQTERILTLKELNSNLQLCKNQYFSTWQAGEMGNSAHSVLPKSFADFMLALVADKIAQKMETNIWRGNSSNTGEFDGFTRLMSLDAGLPSAQEVTGTTVDNSNVFAELYKIIDAMPSALYGKEDLNIYVSQNIYKAYVRALGGYGASGLGAAGVDNKGSLWYNNQALSFEGIPLRMTNGLASNTAVLAQKENLFMGTKLLSDFNTAKVLDMSDLDGSDNVRVIYKMVAGVQYATIEDVVTYGITNSAN
jgi:hypothetical protein